MEETIEGIEQHEQSTIQQATTGKQSIKHINDFKFKKAGGTKAQLIILPEEGHGAGRVAAADPKFADWMFSQQKK